MCTAQIVASSGFLMWLVCGAMDIGCAGCRVHYTGHTVQCSGQGVGDWEDGHRIA